MHNRIEALAWATIATAIIVAPTARAVGDDPPCSPWEQHDDQWPSESNDASAVFDVKRGVLVFVSPRSNAVWEWDGAEWSRITPASEEFQFDRLALAYDSTRESVVMHSGYEDFANDYSTAAWNGVDWIPHAESSPVLFDHAMTYDNSRDRLVMFGGRRPALSADTWESVEGVWTRVATTGPTERYGHAMAYDPVRKVTVMFGGFRSAFLGDTWEWNGAVWTLRAATGPAPRFEHAMTYSPEFGGVVMYGGDGRQGSAGHLDDLWLWDGQSWSRIDQPTPPARFGHAMAHDPLHQRLVVVGGQTSNEVTKDLWDITVGGCTFQGRGGPSTQEFATTTFDSARGVAVLHGGDRGSHGTWEWTGASWRRATISGPAPRWLHASTFDSKRQVTVLYGGLLAGETTDGYVWEWDGQTWRNAFDSGPIPAAGAQLAFDEARQETILFGGAFYGGPTVPPNTWAWNGQAWTMKSTVGPPAQSGHSMAYDPHRKAVVLVGLGETWEWDGTDWARVSTTGPSARHSALMFFDTVRNRIALFGGTSGATEFTDLWEWDGESWTERLIPAGPSPRKRMSGAFDSTRGEFMIHSGQTWNPNLVIYPDTWTLTSLPLPPGDIDGDAAVTMADLMLVVDRFNTEAKHPADLNRDGAVDFTDLNIVLAHFNQSCR